MGAAAIIGGVGVASAVGGTALQMSAQAKEAAAREKAAQQNKQLRDAQAKEILRRLDINLRALGRQREQFLARQVSGASAGGAALSGSVLQNLNETAEAFEMEQLQMRREANFRAQQIVAGAQMQFDAEKAALGNVGLQQAATAIRGVSQVSGSLLGSGLLDVGGSMRAQTGQPGGGQSNA